MSSESLADLCNPGDVINNVVAAAYAGGVSRIIIPGNTLYKYDPSISKIAIPNGLELVGESKSTSIIQRVAGSVGDFGFWLGTQSHIGNFLIDGNGANQTSNSYGICGYQIMGATLEDIYVINNRGIGVGLSDCANVDHQRVSITGGLGSAPGFWCGSDSNASFYAQGGHYYDRCTSQYNQLDGIIIGVPCTIRGGNYSYNGYGGVYNGALGAAGIFTNDQGQTSNVTIDGPTCDGNAEWGINTNLKNGKILNARCSKNQLSGIYIGEYSQYVDVIGNTNFNNCTYTGTGYQNLGIKGGISFANGASDITFALNRNGNDSALGTATQKYGIEFAANAWPNKASNNIIMSKNSNFGNTLANDNILPGTNTYGNLTGLIYDDLAPDVRTVGASTSSTPNVSGLRVIQLVGNGVITNFIGGVPNQPLRVISVSGVQTLAYGSLNMQGSTNFTFNGKMGSSIDFLYLNGSWLEQGRSQL